MSNISLVTARRNESDPDLVKSTFTHELTLNSNFYCDSAKEVLTDTQTFTLRVDSFIHCHSVIWFNCSQAANFFKSVHSFRTISDHLSRSALLSYCSGTGFFSKSRHQDFLKSLYAKNEMVLESTPNFSFWLTAGMTAEKVMKDLPQWVYKNPNNQKSPMYFNYELFEYYVCTFFDLTCLEAAKEDFIKDFRQFVLELKEYWELKMYNKYGEDTDKMIQEKEETYFLA